MPVEIVVPSLGESITEVQVGVWLKAEGARVNKDEAIVEIESEKATVELPAPASGVLAAILKVAGSQAKVGEVIGLIEAAGAVAVNEAGPTEAAVVMPAAERLMHEAKVASSAVQATGPGGRILKEDVQRAVNAPSPSPSPSPTPAPSTPKPAPVSIEARPSSRSERVVRMSPIRRTIAARLLEAQTNAALLTTFNEIDMSAAVALRKAAGEEFLRRHGVKLGYMSLFVAAAVEGLRQIPEVNAQIRGEEIVYRDYCDIGIAVGGGKGLVVPVIRDAQSLSLAEVELRIADFGARAKDGRLGLDELSGGTFSITNGGVYGSLMSTPIVNPPQSAILGLHAIKDRPVAVDGQVAIRPMMYVALTYDHRIIDGKEAVTFLKGIKERLESPTRLLLGL